MRLRWKIAVVSKEPFSRVDAFRRALSKPWSYQHVVFSHLRCGSGGLALISVWQNKNWWQVNPQRPDASENRQQRKKQYCCKAPLLWMHNDSYDKKEEKLLCFAPWVVLLRVPRSLISMTTANEALLIPPKFITIWQKSEKESSDESNQMDHGLIRAYFLNPNVFGGSTWYFFLA